MEMKGSVEELLVDIKNTTELMVDLAYSALLYENVELAQEVVELEEMVDVAHITLIERALHSVERGGSPDAVLAVARLAVSMEVIADAARDLAEEVLKSGEVPAVVRMSISDSDVGIVMVRVAPTSVLAGRTLGDLRLSAETGMWVIAIKRERRWTYGPDENDGIEAGDILVARGPQDSCEELRLIAAGERDL
ncbi:MAG TPA: PhoU family transcriptional regulator [Thermoplasmata archaeon]|nr:PhoU family transcriptional regulator [Thermoplasmata archaeon]